MSKTSRTAFCFSSDNRKSAIQNRKWWGIFAIAFACAFGGVEARAQQPPKFPRIGFLSVLHLSAMADRIEAFRQGLRELGYIEGKNIIVEWRYGNEDPDRVRGLAIELVGLKVEIIVSGGNSSTLAAKKATNTIPVVMTQS